MPTKRTTHRSNKGTKLYAVRDKQGRFKDIQTYKKAHGQNIKSKAKKATPRAKSAAIVTIKDGAKMTPKGRKAVADWLRGRADLLEQEGDKLSKRFVSRYLYA